MSISCEDENYMRLCLLIDIGRKAVKLCFDEEFHPKCLRQTVNKAWTKLLNLKKKNVISELQWKILQGKNTIILKGCACYFVCAPAPR